VRVVVDNSKGSDPEFASDLRAGFDAAGFDVELRHPAPQALYDTTVHFVVEGVVVRVKDDVTRHELARLAEVVRDAEGRRRSARRRFRAVPIYRGETSEVLAWVDVFSAGG
jgi:hypothetical protein